MILPSPNSDARILSILTISITTASIITLSITKRTTPGMSETSFAPKIALVKSQKNMLCQYLAQFSKLLYCSGLKFLVLMCQYDTIKKSYKLLTRILVRGSFSSLILLKRDSDSYLPQATSCLLFFHSKP